MTRSAERPRSPWKDDRRPRDRRSAHQARPRRRPGRRPSSCSSGCRPRRPARAPDPSPRRRPPAARRRQPRSDAAAPVPQPDARADADARHRPAPARPRRRPSIPLPTQRPNLCPAVPGADPVSTIAWIFTPLFQAIFMLLAAAYNVTGVIGRRTGQQPPGRHRHRHHRGHAHHPRPAHPGLPRARSSRRGGWSPCSRR